MRDDRGMSNAESFDFVPDLEVGRRVNMRMWDRHVTQTAIAPKLGISQSVMARKVRGQAGWSIAQLVAAARELGTTVAYLVGEIDDPDVDVKELGRRSGAAKETGASPTADSVRPEGLEPPTF